ncbi:agmatine deiminase family protein [Dysgonomonadaceae bacterium zrk40]|nr:agmatine deiminase family protein [Dysgonomonadaceae bacterium zrk40]
MAQVVFPAEWHPQEAVMITWPHRDSDWAPMLEDVTQTFLAISKEILRREKLLALVPPGLDITSHLTEEEQKNLIRVEVPSNDTWARDHGPITLFRDGSPVVADFGFNGWGLKFAADRDNLINGQLFRKGIFHSSATYQNRLNFILEGGSLESDGEGTLLTTSACLLAPNRNQPMTRQEIEDALKEMLGLERVLWLNHGYLAGDDTDSHIDTLARFCDPYTIAYVKCDEVADEHYESLSAMEQELRAFTTVAGEPYRLVPLPMADAVYSEGERLPATYANFLILNDAVLIPFYGTDKDEMALRQLQLAFPDREVIGVDCSPLIWQHGSLHCVTMQLPKGILAISGHS